MKNRISTSAHPLVKSLLFAATLLVGIGTANAVTIVDTDPGSGFIVPSGGSLGTFSFDLTGLTAVSATVAYADVSVAYSGGADFFLDGVFLGTEGYGFGQIFSFISSDLSILTDELATMTWEIALSGAGCPCVVSAGGETLTIEAVPEPTTLLLMGFGLAGIAAHFMGVLYRAQQGRGHSLLWITLGLRPFI